jgi:hypothetical protein
MPSAWMQQKKRWMARDASTPHVARPDLADPWGDWLGSRGWDWYATMTFAVWIHPDQAAQRYNEWARQLYAEVGHPMEHARALEWQKRGVVHFHALIWNVRRSTGRNAWREKWEEIGEGWCRIEPYDRKQGARFYLGKYVSKGGEVDLLKYGPEVARPDDVRLDPRAGGGRGG